jgi:hypothetical protein
LKYSGRPPSGPVQLRDGFYIEVCSKGTQKGVKIRCDNKKAMELAIEQYTKFKEVIILGEYKDGSPV